MEQNSNELLHYGILGMKWGVRRYQNYDGTLTEAGKKRVSAEYKKQTKIGMSKWNKNYSKTYVTAYNKAADTMNNGGINKYNAEQEQKYGKDYALRQGYIEDYKTIFNSLLGQNLNAALDSFYKTNPNIQKAQSLVEKYGMTEWDELAKSNAKLMAEVQEIVEKNRGEKK